MKNKNKVIIGGVIAVLVILGLFLFFSFDALSNNYNIRDNSTLRKTTFSLVSSAENSTINYKKNYGYIEDIGDGRGYTAGIIGFTTGTGDLLDVVHIYTQKVPNNDLKKYIPALKSVNGTDSHKGLGQKFVLAWKTSANDSKFIQSQNELLTRMYLNPAVNYAKKDGLSPLGQYMYYDALVVHGPGTKDDHSSFQSIRFNAMKRAKTPAQGGNEAYYLKQFLKARTTVMKQEEAHSDLSRLKAQLHFINQHNFNLTLPLSWKMYGDRYRLTKQDVNELP
ncbi:MAG TPA: chitosanase [Bacillales bacterium]|nr:chitosanase [Bacillales bacterium]